MFKSATLANHTHHRRKYLSRTGVAVSLNAQTLKSDSVNIDEFFGHAHIRHYTLFSSFYHFHISSIQFNLILFISLLGCSVRSFAWGTFRVLVFFLGVFVSRVYFHSNHFEHSYLFDIHSSSKLFT